jgi:glutathione synthase/RimK-type ligase-like ATP-grasp enzyme
VTSEDLQLIDSVRYAPVTFQRFIPAQADLRVTIVDGDIFPAEIPPQAGYEADYRAGLGTADVAACDLPEEVSGPLMEPMGVFDLQFGAIDLRRTPEGEYVFFEVNPAGEYLFISQRTGPPIPQAIAAALERPRRQRR